MAAVVSATIPQRNRATMSRIGGREMATWKFSVSTAGELDQKLRGEVLALDNLGRGDEIYGTVIVSYVDEGVKGASLVPELESRGVKFQWDQQGKPK
jgi:hypothetical protein